MKMSKLTLLHVISVAKAEKGYHESPAGSNRTKFGAWYPMNGSPWCGMYVSWCFREDLTMIHGKYARTDSKAKSFNKAGLLHHGHAGMKKGDVIFFAFNGSSYQGRFLGIEHTGICLGTTDDGRYITIEGNTSGGSNANGGAVQVRYRSPSFVAAYFRPEYKTPAAKPATPSKPAAKPAATKAGVVTAKSGLRVRNGAGITHHILGVLAHGTKVTVLDTSKGWDKIKFRLGSGWVKSSYIKC